MSDMDLLRYKQLTDATDQELRALSDADKNIALSKNVLDTGGNALESLNLYVDMNKPKNLKDMTKDHMELLSRMSIEPISPLDFDPLGIGKVDKAVRGAATNIVGPAKFQSALKLIPTVVDKADNLKALMGFDDFLMKLASSEQKELAALAIPRLQQASSNIQSVRRADVIDNPNATSKLISTLDKNEGYYKSLLKKMQEIVAGTYKPMNTGGIATLMPK